MLLDAARALILQGGPSAASARAVSAATGAPSGSIYHRFPRRDDLVAAAWLRAQDRFLGVYLKPLGVPGVDAAVKAATTVLTWSRAHPHDAALLLRYALTNLLRRDISDDMAEHARTNVRQSQDALEAVSAAIGQPLADIVLAVVDAPYAVVRRVLQNGCLPGPADVDAVRRSAALLLVANV